MMNADKLLLPQGIIQIHSYDIGVILGNVVDNAIEACRKLKAKEPGGGKAFWCGRQEYFGGFSYRPP